MFLNIFDCENRPYWYSWILQGSARSCRGRKFRTNKTTIRNHWPKGKFVRCRSNEMLKLWNASTTEQMVDEMPTKWHERNQHTTDWMNQWANDSMNQWINASVKRWNDEPMNQWINKSGNQRVSEWVNRWVMNQCITESVNHWVNESKNPLKQWISWVNESGKQ
jgi:hypothetical protein